jgi:uncharacterized protein
MIIDFHCHGGRGDLMTAPWNSAARLDLYLKRAARAGISKTVLLPAFHSDYRRANEQLARVVEKNPGRLIGFGMVHAKKDRGRIYPMLAKCVREYGFRGIKIHGHEAMPTREVCEAARRLRVPVLVDVAGRAEIVEMIAPEYRDVNFVVPHLGSFADDWRAQQMVVDQLARHPNVYADTSGVRRFDYIVSAVKRAGPHKVLFGSDGPWLHPGVELYKIKMLLLRPEEERLITGQNACRLLKLEESEVRPAATRPSFAVAE